MKWLSNEMYYPIIVKHELLWHKSWGLSFYLKKVIYQQKGKWHTDDYQELVKNYNTWVNESYSIPSRLTSTGIRTFRADIPAIHCKELLASKTRGSTASSIRNRTGYCLTNLIMMATGLNREVVLSWDSRTDGQSILDINDDLFRSKTSSSSPQTLIHGIKNRRGGRKSSKLT